MSVRHSTASFALLLLPFVACAEPAPSITEQDAVALGFRRADCSPIDGVSLYVLTDDPPTELEFCGAVESALDAAAEAGLVPEEALSTDSLAVITVWRGYYAPPSSTPASPSFFLDVTFDLVHRDGNIRVVIDEPATSPPEVSWAPQGLRY